MFPVFFSLVLWFLGSICAGVASEDEQRLLDDLFRGYNQLIQPVQNITKTPVQISFSLALVLLINVDERNQIMQTNVWPTMRWVDYQMRWDPRDYGKIQTIRVPPDRVWLPDIVLFNNADGNYEVSFYSNVVVEYTGDMLWVPPAIYKSSCTIDVEYFPFDEQICAMIFGSWTFNKNEVTIKHADGKRQVELNDYSPSGIWDIIDVPSELIHSKSKIAYHIRIRRKALFYTVILIIPTVLMAFLSMMVFYLPAEATEKITLAINILLALVVFLLLVSKILPPTSSTIPLMAKYLLLIFVLNIITILVTVIVVNIYFRGSITHAMPQFVRLIFLKYLPLLLMMERPIYDETDIAECSVKKDRKNRENKKRYIRRDMDIYADNEHWIKPGEFVETSTSKAYHFSYPIQSTSLNHEAMLRERNGDAPAILPNYAKIRRRSKVPQILEDIPEEQIAEMSAQMLRAIEAIEFIAKHIAKEDGDKKIRVQWKYVSMVIDRVLLYTFFAITAGGTFGVLLSAPNVFEHINQTEIIEKLKSMSNDDFTYF